MGIQDTDTFFTAIVVPISAFVKAMHIPELISPAIPPA